jgi:hypothetical protein
MPAKQKNINYEYLRDRWTNQHRKLQGELVKKHHSSFDWLSKNSKHLALGSLASMTILTSPISKGPAGPQATQTAQLNPNAFITSDLSKLLPPDVRPLTPTEEASISAVLTRDYGVQTKADINGLRLNRTYGLIGKEQHLARFPGDSVALQMQGENNPEVYNEGMAPGLGAWGYFATSQSSMTKEDSDREKYYIAVQTFLSPDFNSKVAVYRDFYKYRKMLVVNPENGKAVVAVVGDAGPAEWTGKHLGGSPEIMQYLERQDGTARGPVLYFFIEDPNNSIPLGPIKPTGNSIAFNQ